MKQEDTNRSTMNIQWYPGHMTKTRRMIEEDVKLVDAVCEILDARIPIASRNPDIDAICGNKPRMIVLNRIDMADPALTKNGRSTSVRRAMPFCRPTARRKGHFRLRPGGAHAAGGKAGAVRGEGTGGTAPEAHGRRHSECGKIDVHQPDRRAQGRKGREPPRRYARQAVDHGRQGLLLLDTPGILWPKFEDPEVGMRLAYTGAVKEDVIDTETLACHFIALLAKYYPQTLSERYKLEAPEDADGYELLQLAGKKRGYLISGGEVNTERMAKALMDDYRSGKLGKLTLESPEDIS